jgi:two-component system, sporulation sensor kinase D
MKFSENQGIVRWIIISVSFLLVVLILWNTYSFFQIFKEDERMKMEWWSESVKTINNVDEKSDVDISLPVAIITNNSTIPIILTDENGAIASMQNVSDDIVNDSLKSNELLEKLKGENKPIRLEIDQDRVNLVYYGNSNLLNTLKFFPIALLLIIFLFALLIYNYYRTNKYATQNKLWAGMAKETAHQIGTPLSSLMGWLELMKADAMDAVMIAEIEKDILRLQTITDRFSKIGSEPNLERCNVVKETQSSCDYLKTRFSKQIDFSFQSTAPVIWAQLNPALHSWTIENLVKNAIDAMKGKGTLEVSIVQNETAVYIYVKDSGKGIPKNEFKKVFEPGFTTKKRGWGLGLSLTKRIVETYHKGKISVEKSEIGKGTTMVLMFKKQVSFE